MDDRPLYIAGPPPDPQRKGPEEWGKVLHQPLHRPITDLDEHELIGTILHHPLNRYDVTNIKGVFSTSARIFERIEFREFKPTLSSDADLLVLPDDTPDQSTAIQVKRFVPQDGLEFMDAWQTNRMQRLFEEGVRQANYTLAIGFSQVYLYVFTLIDTREQNASHYTYAGADAALQARVERAIAPTGLDSKIGLVAFEWVQPMDRPPFELGTFGGHLIRLAERGRQPDDLTDWISKLPQQRPFVDVALDRFPTLRCRRCGWGDDAILYLVGRSQVESLWKCRTCGLRYRYEHATETLRHDPTGDW
jgi:hypothetical protein